jgi:hypothetical protein
MYPLSLFHVTALLNPSQYIGVVLQDRLNSYDPALEPGILGINSVENGMLLRKDLHALFRLGYKAFLKVREVDINSDIF